MGGVKGETSIQIGAKFSDKINRICKKCGNLESECVCHNTFEYKNKNDFVLWVNQERRSGREITLCGEFLLPKESLVEILKKCKKILACGGAIKEGKKGYVLEIQGGHKETLRAFLKQEQFRLK